MVESSIQQVLNDLRQCTAHIDGAGGLPNRINQIRGALASIRKKLDTCNGPGTSNSSQAIQNAIDAARLAIFALHAYVNTARQWQQQVGVGSSATVGADNLTIDSNGGSGTISDRSAEDAPVNNDSLGDASGFTATVGPGTVHYGGTDQAAPGAVGSEGLDKGDGERKDRDSSQSQRNNCDSVDDLIIEINRRQRRHADGKFADKNGGARTYAESENIGRMND